jgi:uncharacterized protein (TIGR03437 family)
MSNRTRFFALGCLALVAVLSLVAGMADGRLFTMSYIAAYTFLGDSGPTFQSQRSPASRTTYIEANFGQASREFAFYAKQGPMQALFSDEGLTLYSRGSHMRVRLEGERARRSKPRGAGLLPTHVNYFVGKDPSRWITDVPTYGVIRYDDVYPGIAAIYYPSGSSLEQDFEVRPGANPADIRMRFDGADSVELAENGALQIHWKGGAIVQWHAPKVYERNGRAVSSRYRLNPDGSAGFETGAYDRSRELVIDPVITMSTYLGGSGTEAAGRVATDAQGNIYMAGTTTDPAFPVTPGAYTNADASTFNAVLLKLNASGSEVLTVTHFGGADPELGMVLAFDPGGNIYMAGATMSADFPTTQGSLRSQAIANDKFSCFVTKLSPTANRLLYSTYLGGADFEVCTAIAVDSTGAAYLGGYTKSRDFPATPDTFQPTYRSPSVTPGFDGFITKLNPAGSGIVYSTFLGGPGTEYLTGLALDAQGNVYVCGATTSSNFPVTSAAFQRSYGGASFALETMPELGDAFVAKIDPTASSILYATYLGGRQDDFASGIAVDGQGNAYVTGWTRSANFPASAGSLQTALRGEGGETRYPSGDAFVTKINPSGSAAVYSTYLGGSLDDRGLAIAVDSTGNAWVTGNTLSTDFPVSADARQTRFGGAAPEDFLVTGDAFVTQLNPAGTRVLYSTYHGGGSNDLGYTVAIARDGGVFVAGSTGSKNLFATPGALSSLGGAGDPADAPFGDVFLLRVGEPPAAPPAPSISSIVNDASRVGGAVSPGLVVTITGENFGASGAKVGVDGIEAPILLAEAKRIVAVMPYAIEGRESVSVVVTEAAGGTASAAVRLPVTGTVPGLYTVDGGGRGLAVASWNEDSTLMTLIGTGEGQTDPAGVDGQVATADLLPVPIQTVAAWIDGQEVEVVRAGAMEGQIAGKFGVTLRWPEGLGPGQYAVTVRVGEAFSQSEVLVERRSVDGAESGSRVRKYR